MKITHHPDIATIMAYASGSLDEAFSVLISCHLETCADCRAALKTSEMIGGSALDDADAVPLSKGAFGRALEMISLAQSSRQENDETRPDKSNRPDWHRMPAALHNYVDSDLDSVKWKWIGPGTWHSPVKLSADSNSTLRLMRIASGRFMPEHSHGGQEITLILRGAYEDKFGRFGPGDVADLDDHVEHQPHVVSDEDCICLAATEAPTRFKSLPGRLLQPLIGI